MSENNTIALSDKRQRAEQAILANESFILQAKDSVKFCESHCYELKSALNDTVYWVSSLPFYILTRIFGFACANQPHNAHFVPVQFVIGATCRSWRQKLWRTPHLWNSVFIYFSVSRYVTQKSLLEAWIERSSTEPLNLFLSKTFLDGWQPPMELFLMLLRSCHRWCKFYTLTFAQFSLVLEEGRGPLEFPMLASIELSASLGCCKDLHFKFNKLPRLQRFLLSCSGEDTGTIMDLICSPPKVWYSWTLGWTSTAPRNSSANYNAHQTLENTNRIQITEGNLSVSPRVAKIINSTHALDTAALLNSVVYPALKRAVICVIFRDAHIPGSEWVPSAVDLTKRSFLGDITELRLVVFGYQDELEDNISDLIRKLSVSNSVRRLELELLSSFDALSGFFISQLTLPVGRDGIQNHGKYLPQLSEFTYTGNVSFSLGALSRMLRSRLYHARAHMLTVNASSGMRFNRSRNRASTTFSSGSSPSSLTITIKYNNIDWFQKQDPNEMRAFYQLVEEFSTEGRQFTPHYDEITM